MILINCRYLITNLLIDYPQEEQFSCKHIVLYINDEDLFLKFRVLSFSVELNFPHLFVLQVENYTLKQSSEYRFPRPTTKIDFAVQTICKVCTENKKSYRVFSLAISSKM